MKSKISLLTLLLINMQLIAQKTAMGYVGIYGDWVLNVETATTVLDLRADKTFKLRTVDYVYPQTHQSYSNEGYWEILDDEVILNPHLQKRQAEVSLITKQLGLHDSIEIKVNHFVEVYENQTFIEKKKIDFDLLTLYFNKKKNYRHLTRATVKEGSCLWAPRIRNRINLDTTNTFKVPKEAIETLGVYTYGFQDFIELKNDNPDADYFEINVVLPIDKERMPRSKPVIIKGKRAYFYEFKGEVRRSLTPLIKKK